MKKIFLLHGWTYSLEKWQNCISRLQKAGYDIIALRVPGLTTTIDKAWELNDYVSWLHAILAKEKGKPILIAHSNGGRIAIAFAAQYPHMVEKLILIDSAGIYHKEIPILIKRFVFSKLARAGKLLTSSKEIQHIFYKLVGEHDYLNAPSLSVRQTLRNLIAIDCTPYLTRLRIPTLIIWGEKDTITPLRDGELMKSLIQQSKLVIVKNSRHAPYHTHTQEVVDVIVKELQHI
ncbi:MAG TPA: alpha/beta hydrolase [Patescibacteria group bacterium]|nr:alpha/beta hydrolase [Patescibacteria group bacterium]